MPTGPSAATDQLATLAHVFMPLPGGGRGTLIEVGSRSWRDCTASLRSNDVVVCGRLWQRSSASIPAAAWGATARELRLGLMRVKRKAAVHAVHRLPPPVPLAATRRADLRGALLQGFLIELWNREDITRVIDAAASAAGSELRPRTLKPGSGLSWIARARSADAQEAVFRMALTRSPGDPSGAAECLSLLERAGVQTVPRLLQRGEVAEASWSTESLLHGTEPQRLNAPLLSEAVAWCGSLPRQAESPLAPQEDLKLVRGCCPDLSGALERLEQRLKADLSECPSVLRHGDLWARNLLAEGDRLTGVVDWDAWHPSGAPGADLVYLFLTEAWRRERLTLGELWRDRRWREPAFKQSTQAYWQSFDLQPDLAFLDAVAAASWAAQIASNLRRVPQLRTNRRWLTKNVTDVLGHLDPTAVAVWGA